MLLPVPIMPIRAPVMLLPVPIMAISALTMLCAAEFGHMPRHARHQSLQPEAVHTRLRRRSAPSPHLHRDSAHPCHICTGTRPIPPLRHRDGRLEERAVRGSLRPCRHLPPASGRHWEWLHCEGGVRAVRASRCRSRVHPSSLALARRSLRCSGAWMAWTPCSRPCGGGTRSHRRRVLVDESNGGTPCPILCVLTRQRAADNAQLTRNGPRATACVERADRPCLLRTALRPADCGACVAAR
jgi:hypothetical protein